MKGFTSEIVRKIWSDEDGDYIYVGPDADALDLVEIRLVDEKGVIAQRFTMHPIQAYLVGKALIAASGEKSLTMPRGGEQQNAN